MQCRLRWLAICGLTFACEGSSANVVTASRSYIEVVPSEFTPEPACQWSGGQQAPFAYYVATLVNLVGSESGGLSTPLPSSSATRCTSLVRFEIPLAASEDSVADKYQFAALVDGYRDIDLTAVDSGERAQLSDAEPVAPSWMWLCGIGRVSDARLAQLRTLASSLTGVAVDPEPAAPDAAPFDAAMQDAAAQDAAARDAAMEDAAAFDSGTVDAAVGAPPVDAAVVAPTGTDGAASDARAGNATDGALETAVLPGQPEPAVPQLGRTVSVRGCVRLL